MDTLGLRCVITNHPVFHAAIVDGVAILHADNPAVAAATVTIAEILEAARQRWLGQKRAPALGWLPSLQPPKILSINASRHPCAF